MVSVTRDVTEQRQAERELRLVRESIQQSPVPTFWIGADARPRFVNAAACTSLGYTADELTAMRVWDFDRTFDPNRWTNHRNDLMRHGHRVLESTHRRKDGREIPVEIVVHYLEFEGDQLSVSFVRDISERKRVERERAESLAREQSARAEAQAANEAKDKFLAVLSHELRNPLAAVVASLDLLRRCTGDQDDRIVRVIEVALRNATLEARLLDDLLDLSRLVRGKTALQRSPFRLERAARLAVESQQKEASAAGLVLELFAEPELWVDGDGERLQEVIANLLANAIKFTPRGGRISVRLQRDGKWGRIVVEDSGIGIEPARLATIFDMMFQHHQPGRRARAGLGIGLALVKSIVEMHSGHVRAESEGIGKGTRMSVELPLRVTDAPPAEPPAALPISRVGGEHPIPVLLVEDNADTRELMAENLRLLGYSVTAAETAEEALTLLSTARPAIILADIGLPGIDGNEFLRQARRIPGVTAPAFALTGFGQEKDVEATQSAGFVEHFVKPVDLDLLDVRMRARAEVGTHA